MVCDGWGLGNQTARGMVTPRTDATPDPPALPAGPRGGADRARRRTPRADPRPSHLRHPYPLQRARLDGISRGAHPRHPPAGRREARAGVEHAGRRDHQALPAGSQAHRAHPAPLSHARGHRPLVAGPVRDPLPRVAPGAQGAQGHRRVPPLRRPDRHAGDQAADRDRAPREHLPPRPLRRGGHRGALHHRAAAQGDLGPRGDVVGPAGGGRAPRPLPEPLGGPRHPQRRRGPGRRARPGLARGVPAPPGPLPRRHRHLGHVTLGSAAGLGDRGADVPESAAARTSPRRSRTRTRSGCFRRTRATSCRRTTTDGTP